jgi:hypothetical protein
MESARTMPHALWPAGTSSATISLVCCTIRMAPLPVWSDRCTLSVHRYAMHPLAKHPVSTASSHRCTRPSVAASRRPGCRLLQALQLEDGPYSRSASTACRRCISCTRCWISPCTCTSPTGQRPPLSTAHVLTGCTARTAHHSAHLIAHCTLNSTLYIAVQHWYCGTVGHHTAAITFSWLD